MNAANEFTGLFTKPTYRKYGHGRGLHYLVQHPAYLQCCIARNTKCRDGICYMSYLRVNNDIREDIGAHVTVAN